jgi:hypothetical protein
MALVPGSVGYSETVISADASTVPTTPDDSLNGGTDELDEESNGSRTTVTEDSDPESITNVSRVRSICCVGAGYVGTSKFIRNDAAIAPDRIDMLTLQKVDQLQLLSRTRTHIFKSPLWIRTNVGFGDGTPNIFLSMSPVLPR